MGCREALLPKRKLDLGQLLGDACSAPSEFGLLGFRWRWSLGGPSAGPRRHRLGCPRARSGNPPALRRKGLRWHTLAVPAVAGSGQPSGFRRERARRNPGWSPGRWERPQTPPRLWGGRDWVGGGPARKPAFSRLPPSLGSQPASQSGSLSVCSVLPCRDVRDFLLGRNQWSSSYPAQMPPNPEQGLRPRDPGGRVSSATLPPIGHSTEAILLLVGPV